MTQLPDCGTIHTETHEAHKRIFDLIEIRSAEAMSRLTTTETIRIIPVENHSPSVMGHRLCLRLLGGPVVKILLKLHYSRFFVLDYLERSHGLTPEDAREEDIAAAVREYANLITNLLKSDFLKADILMAASLPVLARGYDDIHSAFRTQYKHTRSRAWRLTTPSGDIFVSADVFIA